MSKKKEKETEQIDIVFEVQENRRFVQYDYGMLACSLECLEDDLVKVKLNFNAKESSGILVSGNQRVQFLCHSAYMMWRLEPIDPRVMAMVLAADDLVELMANDGISLQIYFADEEDPNAEWLCNCRKDTISLNKIEQAGFCNKKSITESFSPS